MSYQLPYNNLFIADSDYADNSIAAYGAYAVGAEVYWHSLVLMVSQIREAGILEGNAAKSIEEFAKELDDRFKDQLQEIITGTDGLQKNLQTYIIDIDTADDCLY